MTDTAVRPAFTDQQLTGSGSATFRAVHIGQAVPAGQEAGA